MENRLKERLTGAAILVALIVLVVPEMFRGQRDPTAGSGSTSGEGPPVRSYTIDLGSAGAHAAPMQITPPARNSAAQSAPAAVPATASSAPSTPLPVAPTAPSQALVAPARAPAGPTPPGRPAATPPPAQGLAAGPSSDWTVQLGLFAKPENAQRLMHTAQAKGFVPRVSRSGPKGLYRVSVAAADRAAAEQISRRVRAAGLPAEVIGPR